MNAKKMCPRCEDLLTVARPVCACAPDSQPSMQRRQQRAAAAVAKAVKSGQLLPAKQQKCTDCSAQAQCYDHRDYRKPLDVEPVCALCNLKRGPSIDLQQAKAAKS
jgi:hypothetical protein